MVSIESILTIEDTAINTQHKSLPQILIHTTKSPSTLLIHTQQSHYTKTLYTHQSHYTNYFFTHQSKSTKFIQEFGLNMEYNFWFNKIHYNITLWFLIKLFRALLCSFGSQLIDMIK